MKAIPRTDSTLSELSCCKVNNHINCKPCEKEKDEHVMG